MNAAAPAVPATFVHRKRRGAEMVLLVLALAIGVGAYAVVGLTRDGQAPSDIVRYGGGLVLLAVVAHVVLRLRAPYADPVLLPVVVALNGLGLAMIYRLDLTLTEGDPPEGPYAPPQLLWSALGVGLFIAVLLIVRDHRRLQSYTYTLGLLGLGLLLLPLVPGLGTEINGARIWISLLGLSFQPGEAAKVLLVIAFAGYLVANRDALALAGRRLLGIDLPRGRDLGPILAAWGASMAILVFQTDLGSSLLFFGLFVVLLYVATERPGWLFVGGLLFAVGAYAGYVLFGHVQTRVQGWLDPFSDPNDAYLQIVQGQYGLAWGGILGRGLGDGSPTLIPFSFSDFIVAAFGEELGLTGLMAIIVLYALIVERGLRTALVCRDAFGKLLAVGLAASFALQVFVVVGGVTNLIPLTGLTTPFLSAGGSSMVANWVIIALLLRVSDRARRPAPEVSMPEADDATQVVRLR
ncbi:MAG TPA: FtsW/RodA/SpoVE family cell cycle protein [Nocardioidaceae bacterium]|nr:FtsW/RodA/SpoVE family cell cycle protein [Actinomycetota bacterium]HEV8055405.1 FtsW/RodA/SpoVE family cell cycle protein [Nocardioidaceae bacterium]